MILPLECIDNISLYTDYKTTVSIIQTCKYFANQTNIWKDKCNIQYPQKRFFSFYSDKENYLLQAGHLFALGRNRTDTQMVAIKRPFFCEILPKSSFDDVIEINRTISQDFQKQYLFMTGFSYTGLSIYSQHDTMHDTTVSVNKYITSLPPLNYDDFDSQEDEEFETKQILNLEDTIPCFSFHSVSSSL